jgi:type IV fimbrial biogenesis protein FimT
MKSISMAQRGYTLIELMLTITVLSILLGLAVPSFLDTVRNNRLISQNNEFISSLNFARSEALKRSGSVSVCASTDEASCSGSTDWTTGRIVFTDTNANGTFDGADEILQTAGAAPVEFTMNGTASFVRFTSSGMTPPPALEFNLLRPGCTGMHARRINVSVVGRVATTTASC